MSPRKKPVYDETLAGWLREFKKKTTQNTYLCALRKFKKKLDIEDIGEYVKSEPNVAADVRTFLASLDERPSKTVNTYVGAVKMFLQDHGVKIPEDEWRKIKRRGFMPKRVKAETRDRKPTKTMLKKILNYADIKLRASVLFLLSSGARIGETLQLKKEDLDLNADPPRAIIRSEYTKAGVGGRTVYFSYEARDAIKDWLRIKDETGRRAGGGSYRGEHVFPWDDSTSRFMWNRACDKAGVGERDNHTNRRIYHLHSLRKFFRTKIGLDEDITHALMGHARYLDEAYLRLDQEGEIAKTYLEAMPNVSVFEMEDQQLRQTARALEEENVELKKRIAKAEAKLEELEGLLKEVLKTTLQNNQA